MLYESDVDGPLYGMPFNETTGVLSAPSVQTAQVFPFPGAFISVSYNLGVAGTTVVWATVAESGAAANNGIANVHNPFNGYYSSRLIAFSSTLAVLYDSSATPSRDTAGSLAKFNPPMPINGRVYVPANEGFVNVYGLGTTTVSTVKTVIGYR